ncbi:DEAD/DEAH box helicase [Ammoniphilus resinae]|uniref:Competence protein ComFA n=1 Tax=Ammoniphilus resinae TaxID=861532 RepID=A0ABS4GQK7_9BACL|nr:helicase-related protein [Ammoniphilus resinae]MBP1932549.1 competence protein ComFA [Ammoniphilus resinae]
MNFFSYEINGRRYLSRDLSFDLLFWSAEGYEGAGIEQTTEPASLAHLEMTKKRKGSVHPITTAPHSSLRLKQAKHAATYIPRGRALLAEELETFLSIAWEEAIQLLHLQGEVEILPGVSLKHQRCNRCGSTEILPLGSCASCGQVCAYCPSCLQMGRAKACTPLFYIHDPEPEGEWKGGVQQGFLNWKGTLTPAQQEAADEAVTVLKREGDGLLIWAVCGAGKTEVVFTPMDEALRLGRKVMLATPRKDVVIELAPRIQEAFPTCKVIALHGKSTQKWDEAAITLATTHQAMRFYQKFDLVILDEVDAFPYHGNPILYRAVERAKKPTGNILYLSATPPRYLLRKIPHVKIPARFHRKPLAVPQVLYDYKLVKRIKNQTPIPYIPVIMEFLYRENRQALVFVPYIEWVELVVAQLAGIWEAVEGTHSRDRDREEKVQRFRRGEIRVLVTTTILERGVTIPKTDVVVIHADSTIFDEASLVQMSGRTGRSSLDPIGHVIFLAAEKTRAIKKAVKQIQTMNRTAKKRGLIE